MYKPERPSITARSPVPVHRGLLVLSVHVISNSIICATPRSGSNYLCELLASLGFAGRAGEHLWDPPGTEQLPLAERWPRVLAAGRDPSGVFSVKLMWYQADRLERELPEILGMPGEPLGPVLSATFNDPQYIYLTRRDHLRQAISFVRAIQTEQWRSMDNAAREPHYDANAIGEGIRFLANDEASWEAFFTRNVIAPYRLCYEDLNADPQRVLAALVRYLGGDETRVSLPMGRHQRQADAVTDEWAQRYTEGRETE